MPSLPEPTDASAFCTLTCDHVVEMAICERTYSVKSKFFYILMTGWCFRREFFSIWTTARSQSHVDAKPSFLDVRILTQVA